MRVLQLLFAVVVILLLQGAPGKDKTLTGFAAGLEREKAGSYSEAGEDKAGLSSQG